MKFRTKLRNVTAMRFDGTNKSALQIRAWVEGELPGFARCASTIFDPKDKVVRLIVHMQSGEYEIAAGDWVVASEDDIHFHSNERFEGLYESVPE